MKASNMQLCSLPAPASARILQIVGAKAFSQGLSRLCPLTPTRHMHARMPRCSPCAPPLCSHPHRHMHTPIPLSTLCSSSEHASVHPVQSR
eukprot:scaffold282708_cov22-Tisochrysis_lutea.AAC.2